MYYVCRLFIICQSWGLGFRKLSVGQQSKEKDKLSVLFKINVRREIKAVFLGFFGKLYNFRGICIHYIFCYIRFFVLRKKRRKLNFGEKQQIAILCLVAKIKLLLKIAVNIFAHSHLCQCNSHNKHHLSLYI